MTDIVVEKLEFLGLRYFGVDGPLAIFRVGDQQRIYDQNGLRDLLEQQMALGGDVGLIRQVIKQCQIQPSWQLQDLSDSDVE